MMEIKVHKIELEKLKQVEQQMISLEYATKSMLSVCICGKKMLIVFPAILQQERIHISDRAQVFTRLAGSSIPVCDGKFRVLHTGKTSAIQKPDRITEVQKDSRSRAKGETSTRGPCKPIGITKRPTKPHEKAGYIAGLLALVSTE